MRACASNRDLSFHWVRLASGPEMTSQWSLADALTLLHLTGTLGSPRLAVSWGVAI